MSTGMSVRVRFKETDDDEHCYIFVGILAERVARRAKRVSAGLPVNVREKHRSLLFAINTLTSSRGILIDVAVR